MAKPEPEPSVLVLRECEEGEGRGYAMELAPLAAAGASPPAHGAGSSSAPSTGQPPSSRGGAASRAAATVRGMAASLTSQLRSRFSKMEELPVLSNLVPGGSKGRDTAPVPTPRSRGGGKTAEEASGSAPRARTRDAAAATWWRGIAAGLTPHGRGSSSRTEEALVPPSRAPGCSKPRDAAPVRTPPSRSSTHTREAATVAGTAAGGDDTETSVAERDPTATARARILQDLSDLLYRPSPAPISSDGDRVPDVYLGTIGQLAAAGVEDTDTSVAESNPTGTARARILQDLRDFLYRPSPTPISSDGDRVPEVSVDIAALLAASGGGARPCGSVVRRGGTEAAGYVMPVFMVPTVKPDESEEKEDKRISVAKIIYGVLLITVLTYVTPVIDALESMGMSTLTFWVVFGLCWGLLSVGFHASLSGSVGRLERAYIEFVAHFSLILFCAFVVYCIYLKLPKDAVTVGWLIFMETSLVIAHIFSWVLVHKNTKTSTKLA